MRPDDPEREPTTTRSERAYLSAGVEVRGDTARLMLRGELDVCSCEVLLPAAEAVIALAPTHLVVVDLAQLSFTDVAGLRALSRVAQRVAAVDGVLRVCRASPWQAGLIERLGFDGLSEDVLCHRADTYVDSSGPLHDVPTGTRQVEHPAC